MVCSSVMVLLEALVAEVALVDEKPPPGGGPGGGGGGRPELLLASVVPLPALLVPPPFTTCASKDWISLSRSLTLEPDEPALVVALVALDALVLPSPESSDSICDDKDTALPPPVTGGGPGGRLGGWPKLV